MFLYVGEDKVIVSFIENYLIVLLCYVYVLEMVVGKDLRKFDRVYIRQICEDI